MDPENTLAIAGSLHEAIKAHPTATVLEVLIALTSVRSTLLALTMANDPLGAHDLYDFLIQQERRQLTGDVQA